MKYLAIAYYHFFTIENPHLEIKRYKSFLKSGGYKGRIYISEEGVNAQMSADEQEAKAFIEWLVEDERYNGVSIKTQECAEHAFYKMTVKYREQLCAFDEKVDLHDVGIHVSPENWKKMLEEKDDNTIVLDVRNSYESKVGHFEGAITPDLETFREFPGYADTLKDQVDPEKGIVMMYCTGGIRCEYYSSYLKKKGFKNIYQLDGGVINYGNKEGTKYWKGKLFVFDDRLVAPISEGADTISRCIHCGKECDTYYNCANMDCNELFLSCVSCSKEYEGLCSEGCKDGRVRPFDSSDHPKPFRKFSSEDKEKLCGC